MKRRHWVIAGLLLLVLYLACWPVPVDPVAWQAPPAPALTGVFAPNERLGPLTDLPLLGEIGPEHVTVDAQGRLYTGTRGGKILRFAPDGSGAQVFAETGGRPLGMELAADGTLYVADAMRGLLAVSADGKLRVLATTAGGVPIGFADDLDIGPDGTVYFSDASTKFRPQDHGGEMAASLLDTIEHRGNGRLLAHDPRTGKTRVLLKGLFFTNGVAVAHDGRSVLFNETGAYRVSRYWLAGEKAGRAEPFLENLPGFPDNIGRGLDGRYWVSLIKPRSKELDALAPSPGVRAMVMRIPQALQPQPPHRGHVFAVDDTGKIVASLQSTSARFDYTGATETAEYLFLGSIDSTALQRLPRPAL